jgi:DNA-binding response OmpR family regulator
MHPHPTEDDVHLLVLSDRPADVGELLPALEFLDHQVTWAALASPSTRELSACDVVLVDGRTDLRGAAGACRQAMLAEFLRGVVVVVTEGGLAALKLGWGFDDWLLPHAGPAEIETRLRLARDRASSRAEEPTAAVGDLIVDEDSYQVHLRGEPLDLTYKEFELLKALAMSPNRVFTRELLLSEVWGYDYYGGSRTVDVHIRRLRAKLGPEHESMIVTVRGVGYKLVPEGRRAGASEPDDAPAGA